jgi:hypothetical protein
MGTGLFLYVMAPMFFMEVYNSCFMKFNIIFNFFSNYCIMKLYIEWVGFENYFMGCVSRGVFF